MSRIVGLVALALQLSPFCFSKDKSALPAYVLSAETVLVVIDPDAGEPLTSPGANSAAREDVERAIMKWGRFRLAMETQTADLIIAVHKGTGRAVTPTIHGGPLDQRPVILQPSPGDIRIGGRRGNPPDLSQTSGQSQDTQPRMRTEVGASEDMLAVYRGRIDYPLDSAPVWRYVGKDSLGPPSVRAIDEFRKVVIATERHRTKSSSRRSHS